MFGWSHKGEGGKYIRGNELPQLYANSRPGTPSESFFRQWLLPIAISMLRTLKREQPERFSFMCRIPRAANILGVDDVAATTVCVNWGYRVDKHLDIYDLRDGLSSNLILHVGGEVQGGDLELAGQQRWVDRPPAVLRYRFCLQRSGRAWHSGSLRGS
jgi:hypothetical protein